MQREITRFFDHHKGADASLAAGRVRLSGLQEVRDFIGDGWEELNRRIEVVVEAAFDPIPDDSGAYARHDDATFVFLATGLVEVEIDRLSREISDRVRGALNGENAPAGGALDARCDLALVDWRSLDAAVGTAPLAASIDLAVDAAQARQRQAFEADKQGLKPLYWPMTNVSKGLISFYRTEIIAQGESGQTEPGSAVFEEFDMFGLERLAADLSVSSGPRNRANALLSVHFQTLAERPSRMRFLDLANGLGPAIRRRIAVEISDLPAEIAQARLSQLFTEMSPYFLGIVCRFPVGFSKLDRLDGLRMMGVSLDGSILGKDRPRKAQFREILHYARRAKARKLRTFFIRAASVEAARAARRGEFDYIAGPGVLQPLPRPGRVYKV